MEELTSHQDSSDDDGDSLSSCSSTLEDASVWSEDIDADDDSFIQEEEEFTRSLWVLRFAAFADAVASQALGPNYALLLAKGESFANRTGPLGFGAAQYFLPMCSELGMVLSCILFGHLSKKTGRKRCIITCLLLSAAGSILKVALRDNFLTFAAANFATGLLGGGILSLGMAFIRDVAYDQDESDAEIASLVAFNLIGRMGGGILAIAFKSYGLFAPLWATAITSLLSGALCQVWLLDPAPMNPEGTIFVSPKTYEDDLTETTRDETDRVDDDELCFRTPGLLDRKTLSIVLLGELLDNLGSIGVVSLSISPLLFQTFHSDQVSQDMEPTLSTSYYQWIYVLVAVMIIPGAVLAPPLFEKIGTARSAVFSNLFTAAVTIALSQIATRATPSKTLLVLLVALLYLSLPLVTISQLSVGPMLDAITTIDQRRAIQTFNMTTMSLVLAIGPFLYGMLAEYTSINYSMNTAAAFSVLAAVINSRLVKDQRFGPKDARYDNSRPREIRIEADR